MLPREGAHTARGDQPVFAETSPLAGRFHPNCPKRSRRCGTHGKDLYICPSWHGDSEILWSTRGKLAGYVRKMNRKGAGAMSRFFCKMRAVAVAFTLIGACIPALPGFAQSVADEAFPVAGPDRMTLIKPARAEAERQLGRPVELEVSSMLYKHSWVFLFSTMVDKEGNPIDLTGTKLEEAAQACVASRVFCALLKWDADRWKVVASCLGATDVAWSGWDRKYHAPPEKFELENVD